MGLHLMVASYLTESLVFKSNKIVCKDRIVFTRKLFSSRCRTNNLIADKIVGNATAGRGQWCAVRLSSASSHTSNSNRYETGAECTYGRASDAYSVTGAVDPHCKPMVVVTYFESLFLLCIFRSRHVRGHRSLGFLSEWRGGTAGLQKGQQPSGSRQR